MNLGRSVSSPTAKEAPEEAREEARDCGVEVDDEGDRLVELPAPAAAGEEVAIAMEVVDDDAAENDDAASDVDPAPTPAVFEGGAAAAAAADVGDVSWGDAPEAAEINAALETPRNVKLCQELQAMLDAGWTEADFVQMKAMDASLCDGPPLLSAPALSPVEGTAAGVGEEDAAPLTAEEAAGVIVDLGLDVALIVSPTEGSAFGSGGGPSFGAEVLKDPPWTGMDAGGVFHTQGSVVYPRRAAAEYDPLKAPQRAKTAWNYYTMKTRRVLVRERPQATEEELQALLKASWEQLPAWERSVHEGKAAADRERHASQLALHASHRSADGGAAGDATARGGRGGRGGDHGANCR